MGLWLQEAERDIDPSAVSRSETTCRAPCRWATEVTDIHIVKLVSREWEHVMDETRGW